MRCLYKFGGRLPRAYIPSDVDPLRPGLPLRLLGICILSVYSTFTVLNLRLLFGLKHVYIQPILSPEG